MLANMLVVAGQVVMLFLMIGIGFVLAKCGKLTEEGRAQMTELLVNVAVPCVIIDALQTPRTGELIRAMGIGLVLLCVIYMLWILLSHLLFRRTPVDIQVVLRYGMLYGNQGFMGMPLIDSVLGPGGLIYATVSHVAFNAFAWSQGVALMGGREEVRIKKIFLNPGVIGCVVGVAFFLLDFRLPGILGQTVRTLASLNTPLAMVVIGALMAESDLLGALRDWRLYVASAVRLVVFPAILAAMLLPLRLDPMMYAALVILGATPAAGYTAIFAQRFERDTGKAAQLVSLCTLLSILTLPIFSTLGQQLPALLY